MWLMFQQSQRDDYVITTGETHSVRKLCEVAFGLDWERHVRVDAKYLRPTEGEELCGDASKASARFGWEARTTFLDLVRLMLEQDLADVRIVPAKHLGVP